MSVLGQPFIDRRVMGETIPPEFPGDEEKWRVVKMEMIHVVFFNNGSVQKITHCPEGMAFQSWFNFLSRSTVDRYEPLSGGRGVFRFEPGEIETLNKKAMA
jgi:hypothetical protein